MVKPKLKKVIILIVEGTTDELLYQTFIEKMINKHKLTLKVVHSDVFTNKANINTPSKAIVGNIVNMVMKETKFLPSDIALIAQITDTDGAFIPKSDYCVDDSRAYHDNKSYVYDLSQRKVAVKDSDKLQKLQDTWKIKREKMSVLKSGFNQGTSRIPYRLYYNSLNLEHVTRGDILAGDEKTMSIVGFISKLEEDFENYLAFFEQLSIAETYENSWEFGADYDWTRPRSNIQYLNSYIREIELKA